MCKWRMSQVLISVSAKMRQTWRLDTGNPGKKTLLTQNRQEEVHLPLVAGREGGGEDGRARKTRQIKTVKNNNYRISMFALIWNCQPRGLPSGRPQRQEWKERLLIKTHARSSLPKLNSNSSLEFKSSPTSVNIQSAWLQPPGFFTLLCVFKLHSIELFARSYLCFLVLCYKLPRVKTGYTEKRRPCDYT